MAKGKNQKRHAKSSVKVKDLSARKSPKGGATVKESISLPFSKIKLEY